MLRGSNRKGNDRRTMAVAVAAAVAGALVAAPGSTAAQELPEPPTKLVTVQAAAVEGTPLVRVSGTGTLTPPQAVTVPDGEWQELVFEVAAETTINDLRITYLGGEDRPMEGGGGGGEPPVPAGRTVTVRARGNLGTEEADLYVNGSLVESFALSTDYQTFTYRSAVEVTSLRVGHDSGSWPNAVVVDHVDVNGDRYQSEDPGVVSVGSWTSFTGCERGNKQSEWLSCDNAYFDYPLASVDDLFRIVVRARGNQGTETAELAVNGEPVASWDVSTEFQEFEFLSPASQIENVSVGHNSGNWPNALIVDRVDADWQRMEMEYGYATGQWTPATGCGAVNVAAVSEWLACDGGFLRYFLTFPLLPGGAERAAVRIGEVTIDGAAYSVLDPGVSKVPAKNCERSNMPPDVLDCTTQQFAFPDVGAGG